MTTIPNSVREFLETGPLAHVVTIDPDGTPHVHFAWAGIAPGGDELVMASFYGLEQPKVRNLKRDPRVVLSFQAKEFDGQGLWPYVVVEGRATITEGGALEVMDHLAQYYIGPGAVFWRREVPPGIVYHLTPERFYGQGAWREQP